MTDIDLDDIPIEQRPAKTLTDVARTVTLQPLPVGDRRYVDLSPGAGTTQLMVLRQNLEEIAEAEEAVGESESFAKILVSGHRGCGKTTELLRVEEEFQGKFTSLHLEFDETLRDEFDYTLFCLWLVQELTTEFAKRKMPLPEKQVEEIENWFAEKIIVARISASGAVAAEVEARIKAEKEAFGFGLGFLAKYTASARLDRTRQSETKRVLRSYARELIDKMNLLFATVRQTLIENGMPPRLLVVQDNLDRLSREAAVEFFLTSGETLYDLRAHIIFTTPTAAALAPAHIQINFPTAYVTPMVKVRTIDGAVNEPGRATLRAAVLARVDASLFDEPAVLDELVDLSGGSIRDLMRMLDRSARHARALKRPRIGRDNIAEAVSMMLMEHEGALIPQERYFDWLAEIDATHKDGCAGDWRTQERFAELLFFGRVLAYNNQRHWYGVHPVLKQSWLFEDAVKKAAAKTDV
jgi:hypothetical protein